MLTGFRGNSYRKTCGQSSYKFFSNPLGSDDKVKGGFLIGELDVMYL